MFNGDDENEPFSFINTQISPVDTNVKFMPKTEKVDVVEEVAVKEGKVYKKADFLNNDEDYTPKPVKTIAKRRRNTPHSIRAKFISEIESGICTRRTAAAKYGLHYEQVRRTYRRYLDNGSQGFVKKTVYKPKKLYENHSAFILNMVKEKKNISLDEIRKTLIERFGLTVSITAISRHLSKYKNGIPIIKEEPKVNVTQEMREYCQSFLGISNDEENTVIFFDEMKVEVSLTQSVAKRAKLTAPALHTKNLTIMAALARNQLLFYKALDGEGNKQLQFDFLAELIDLLDNLNITKATMIMGEACCDRSDEIENLVLAAGHEVLYLPTNCPFLNPIEKMFTQWKNHIRSVEPCRDDKLKDVLSELFGSVTQNSCLDYYEHAVHNASNCLLGGSIQSD